MEEIKKFYFRENEIRKTVTRKQNKNKVGNSKLIKFVKP
jgi:hypothetical protein